VIFPGASAAQPLDDAALAQLRYRYVLDDGPIILCVGRFVRRKGHVTLIRSLPRILERFPNAQLVLVGRGPEMWAASNETHTLGVRNHVVFPGCVSEADLAGLYQACTLFALPAGEDEHGQVEGFGLVFAEAHAYGKPVVAGRSGGVVDAVIDGETGLLVEPDDPEALATAIVSILEDTELAQRLGENGKRRVEAELNWTRFTQRLLESVEARR
jgi:phosphatidylinositol alpha-1,6-mannosyltransferase